MKEREERLDISSNGSAERHLEDGTVIIVRKNEPLRPIPGRTAKHEAAHVASAGEIVEADIIPRGGALGTTRPVKMTVAVAAAAGAMGYEGIAWDKYITENYHHVPWGRAMVLGRASLVGKEMLMDEIATTLEEKKRIVLYDVKQAEKRVEEKKKGIFPVIVDIYNSKSGLKLKSGQGESLHGEVRVNVPEPEKNKKISLKNGMLKS